MSLSRILMFGHCHGVHVRPLAGALKQRARVDLSVFEVIQPGSEMRGKATENVFQNSYSVPEKAKDFWKGRLPALSGRAGGTIILRGLSAVFPGSAHRRRLKLFGSLPPAFDFFHLHFMSPVLAEFVCRLPKSKPLLVSIWGSDLLRTHGVEAYAAQLAICKRADLITVRSVELKEILLAKFGRDLESKVRIAKFASQVLGQLRQSNLPLLRQQFREDFQIAADKICVCVGHNGVRGNQHGAILKQLRLLPADVRAKLVLIFPLSYGASGEYAGEVAALVKATGLDHRLMTHFLSETEVLKLRAGSDIIIHVPVSDALSGAMCETIFAGNIAITGNWLPYGELRRRQIHFQEVGAIADLPRVLLNVVENWQPQKELVALTKDRLREILDWEQTIDGWVQVYKELGISEISPDSKSPAAAEYNYGEAGITR